MVAVIDRLEAKGFVVRAPSPRDRRSYALRLAPAGEDFVERMLPVVQEHDRSVAGSLTAEERATLIALLQKIAPPPL